MENHDGPTRDDLACVLIIFVLFAALIYAPTLYQFATQ